MRTLSLLFLFLIAPSIFAASAKVADVVLYQPDAVLKKRIGDVTPLADYIHKIEIACEAAFTSDESEGLDVVIVVKPNGQTRVWFVSSLAKMPGRPKLKAEIEAITAPTIKGGPLAFAIRYDLNGFTHRDPEGGKFQPPVPTEWSEKTKEVKEPLIVPDGFIPYIWPD